MASPFAITTASNTVLLNDKRQGQVTFTVNNISGRPLRGRARLVPQNPAIADWLKIAGDAERDLVIAGTQQYTAQVSVPPKGAAGNYTFRLDMVAVDNPDEDFTQGPTVTFQAPATGGTGFPWWILLVALALLVLVGGGAAVAWRIIAVTPTPTSSPTPTPTATEISTPTPTPTPTATSTSTPTPLPPPTPTPGPTRVRTPLRPRPTLGPVRVAPRATPPISTPRPTAPRPRGPLLP